MRLARSLGLALVLAACWPPRARADDAAETPEPAASPAAELARAASARLASGDFEGALESALAAIRTDPTEPRGHLRAAEALNKLGRYAEAEASARQALALDPRSGPAAKNLAWALLKQERYSPAREAALEAARLKPDLAEAWAIAAYASERLGALSDRDQYLKKAAELSSRYQVTLNAAMSGASVYQEKAAAGGPGGTPPWATLGAGALGFLAITAALTLRSRGRRAPAAPNGRAGPPGAVGKYRVSKLIGKGGMGEVYLGSDTVLGREVAIKKMTDVLADAEARAAFMREARMVAQFHHPAIVEIYDVIDQAGQVYLVFELLQGKTVYHVLAESGKLPLKRAAEILRPVCAALDYAHGRSVVHRDLKPTNIMLTDYGQVKLMDFGVARFLAEAGAEARQRTPRAPAPTPTPFARTEYAVGTPPYMAPEAEDGVVCKEGDVFALGATLYEMLTGLTPFGSELGSASKKAGRFRPASELASGLPSAVDIVLERALRPDPRQRFRSAAEFMAAVEAAAA